MVTGVECAGLVLAVLPLLIEAAKVYSEGFGEIKDVAFKSHQDDILQVFYEDFLIEVTFINRNLERALNALRGVTSEQKAKLQAEFQAQAWRPEDEVGQSLMKTLGNQYRTFEMIIVKLMRLVGSIINDKMLGISTSGSDAQKMYEKLQLFYINRKQDDTLGSLSKRLKFRFGASKRQQYLRTLQHYSKHLERLINIALKAEEREEAHSSELSTWLKPVDQVLAYSKTLYKALSSCWACGCQTRHEARFCLKVIRSCAAKTYTIEDGFDAIIDTSDDPQGRHWCEAVLVIRNKSSVYKQRRVNLSKICEAAQSIPKDSLSLQVLIEDLGNAYETWQLRSQPKRLQLFHAMSPTTLHDLLLGPDDSKLDLKSRRQLALTIALSSLGLDEHTWLRRGWSKDDISFFKTQNGFLDNEKPFISTNFDNNSCVVDTAMSACHNNERLLALGVLLIEIHIGHPIERYQTEHDLTNGQPNEFTKFTVANRVAQKMEFEWSKNYNSAVKACLTPTWLPGDQEIKLDDPKVRNGLYIDVIQPLKEDLIYLFGVGF